MEVHFRPDLQSRLDELALNTGRSLGQLLEDIVANYFDGLARRLEEPGVGTKAARINPECVTVLTPVQCGDLPDYSSHSDVRFSGIFLEPKLNPPDWARSRAILWKAAVAAENGAGVPIAQEIILALPHELNDQQRQWMVTDFVREQITRGKPRVADVSIHAGHEPGGDYHAHILLLLRAIGPGGFGESLSEVSPETVEHWREKWDAKRAYYLRRVP